MLFGSLELTYVTSNTEHAVRDRNGTEVAHQFMENWFPSCLHTKNLASDNLTTCRCCNLRTRTLQWPSEVYRHHGMSCLIELVPCFECVNHSRVCLPADNLEFCNEGRTAKLC